MAILKNKNFAFSTLASGILVGGGSVTVTTGHGVRFPSTGNFRAVMWGAAYPAPSLDATREIVQMTLTAGDVFAITRAQESTAAKAWDAGDNIALVFTAGKMEELEALTQNKLLSFSTATGTNTYTAVMDPAITAYVTGMAFNIKFTNASTGACTLGLNALAAKKMYKVYNGTFTQVTSGDIGAAFISTVFYDAARDGGAGGWIFVTPKITFPSEFASGTALTFPQASPPTGWTLDSSWATVRSILLGNSYGNGGADSATSFTTSVGISNHASHLHPMVDHLHATASHILTTAQMPSHTHNFSLILGAGSVYATHSATGSYSLIASSTGSGSGHNHGNTDYSGLTTTGNAAAFIHSITQSTYSPRYVTVIRATKD